ncbi:1-deoxy-D-xylulose-5-phosphate reductoisomerase [candidate division KSB3 bacterium]|uniref:1-deoxy-D-xylulose 5-phosphate reductoisomerase n=1 Tax=candidate division KSB3 bacterium TaxID=2044937 RepID=A0A2G6E1L0_9BACT|nr:MAG: 1-deoxy-D-xylulose-5-phosphate reductoisomerase [candidate division KSB3 bacterium]PIE28590.1 MAG: 1-deoxy-D-xylulose-5-phosphate reductoisomerase [candidate division KSB3 bacterium]
MVKKTLSILGASGSIGLSALNVIEQFPERFTVIGLAVQRNIERLEEQIRHVHPRIVSVADDVACKHLRSRCADLDLEIVSGESGAVRVATHPDVEQVISAISGCAGLVPTYEAVLAGKEIALANKETLVAAGELIMAEVQERKIALVPVDSEHNAIFQSLQGHRRRDVQKILLTCSGGPFRQHTVEEFKTVTRADALKHPNWEMGQKITIDSATLMNKGLEVLEAHWLFGVDLSDIQVVVHPQSVIHSMVEYCDGSLIAQLGVPDMRIPIAYAMAYPERLQLNVERLDVARVGEFTFEEPDFERFPCLRYAYEAGRIGGTMPAVLNAANEIAVEAFLQERIAFPDIPRIVETVMEAHASRQLDSLDTAIDADRWAREQARHRIAQKK